MRGTEAPEGERSIGRLMSHGFNMARQAALHRVDYVVFFIVWFLTSHLCTYCQHEACVNAKLLYLCSTSIIRIAFLVVGGISATQV